jgi:hypothetical protein
MLLWVAMGGQHTLRGFSFGQNQKKNVTTRIDRQPGTARQARVSEVDKSGKRGTDQDVEG